MSETQNIIIGTALGGTISIFSAYFGYRWTRNINRIAEFNKAASEFRSEFADVLYYLRLNTEDDGIGKKELIFKIINTNDLIRYERAIILFEPFVEKVGLDSFRSDWHDCKKYMQAQEQQWADSKNPTIPEWVHHIVVNTDKGLNLNQEYLKHINKILSYAQPK